MKHTWLAGHKVIIHRQVRDRKVVGASEGARGRAVGAGIVDNLQVIWNSRLSASK